AAPFHWPTDAANSVIADSAVCFGDLPGCAQESPDTLRKTRIRMALRSAQPLRLDGLRRLGPGFAAGYLAGGAGSDDRGEAVLVPCQRVPRAAHADCPGGAAPFHAGSRSCSSSVRKSPSRWARPDQSLSCTCCRSPWRQSCCHPAPAGRHPSEGVIAPDNAAKGAIAFSGIPLWGGVKA